MVIEDVVYLIQGYNQEVVENIASMSNLLVLYTDQKFWCFFSDVTA